MITIKLPATVPAVRAVKDGVEIIVEAELVAADTLRAAVLTLPFWKEGADLKRIDAALELEDALDLDAQNPTISIDCRGLLKEAMTLRLPNGNHGTIGLPRQNRFFMRIFRAVCVAEDVPAEKKKP